MAASADRRRSRPAAESQLVSWLGTVASTRGPWRLDWNVMFSTRLSASDCTVGTIEDMDGFSRRQWIALALPLLRAQEEPTFRTSVRVVNVLATVLNKSGEIIRSLEKDDFLLAENGRTQEIRYFARQTDLPLTLGLMVDASLSQEKVLPAERGASLRFFDQVLRENKDKAFIMQFDMNYRVRQALTSSVKDLEEALSFVDTPTRGELMTSHANGGTLLFDSLSAGCQMMKAVQGRKALLVMTDGVDDGSEATVPDVIEAADKSDTLIYSILFADSGFYSGFVSGSKALSRMARETGGSYFEVSKKRTIEQVFAIIQDELRSQYSIGYVSDEPVRFSEFRKIQLTTKQKGLVVQARDRYWAQR